MSTKILMTSSAVFMATLGIILSFFPQETLGYAGSHSEGFPVMMLQTAGGLYLGFAILNWIARSNLIGGIYSRPVAVGNFLHFSVVSIVLIKAVPANQGGPQLLVIPYLIFAVWFGRVLFRHPIPNG